MQHIDVSGCAQPRAKRRPHIQQPLEAADNPNALLRLSTAAALMGCGVQTVYDRVQKDPTFPRLIKRGVRCTRIRAGDLTTWLRAQAGVTP